MNEHELRQYCANLTGPQLVAMCQNVEAAFNQILPLAQRSVELSTTLDSKTKELESDKNFSPWLVTLLSAGIAVLLFCCRGIPFLGWAFLLGAIVVAGYTVLSLYGALTHKSDIKKLEQEITELRKQLEAANAEMNQVKSQYNVELAILNYVFPPETRQKPGYLHQFADLFVSGRAATLKEGYLLFDEFLHRERMEQMASAQLDSARAAEAAAYQAMHAAQSAEVTANRAKNSADWAAFNSRYNQ